METRKTSLETNKFYHIYNRGINGQNIFLEERNYTYFLMKYGQYIYPFVNTYSYCLLKNHFHLLIKVKSEEEIRSFLNGKHESKSESWIVSNAFASLFKSYAQAINKQFGRTGSFFEEPFHRICVDNEVYFSRLVWYIHYNPQKHGFVSYFRDYPYSSSHSHLVNSPTKLERNEVINWFGSKEAYQNFHGITNFENEISKYILEF
ncbi:MAG: transposase [Candidatus Methylacidiphilales bacterium]